MRRAIAILLLLVFIFNVIGYYGMYWFAREHFHTTMLQKLDAGNYSGYETITLKIPISLPYQLNSNDAGYERINGSFEYNSEFYKLVKEKMEQDTLYIVCIKDHREKQLHTTLVDFVKISSDIPTSSKNIKVLSGFVKDFESGKALEILTGNCWQLNQFYTFKSYSTLDSSHAVLSPPPEFLS